MNEVMWKYFFLIFLSTSLYGFEVKRVNERIILYGSEQKYCDKMPKEILNLKNWSASLDENKSMPVPEIKPGNKIGSCYVDITDCVPEFVKKYQDVNPSISGPNCWNIALVFAKVVPGLRYTSPEEFAFYLSSPLCKKIQESDKQAGDIGVTRAILNNGTIKEIHGYIYISNNLVFAKQNNDNTSPYKIQTMKENDRLGALESISYSPLCDKKYCSVRKEFFRCEPLKNYLSAHSVEEKEVKSAFLQMENEECLMNRFILSGFRNEKKLSLEVAAALMKLSEEKLKAFDNSTQTSEASEFLWEALRFRANLLYEQATSQSWRDYRDEDFFEYRTHQEQFFKRLLPDQTDGY